MDIFDWVGLFISTRDEISTEEIQFGLHKLGLDSLDWAKVFESFIWIFKKNLIYNLIL